MNNIWLILMGNLGWKYGEKVWHVLSFRKNKIKTN